MDEIRNRIMTRIAELEEEQRRLIESANLRLAQIAGALEALREILSMSSSQEEQDDSFPG